MSVDQASVVEYIKNLKLGEVKALIEVLEEELGSELKEKNCDGIRRL